MREKIKILYLSFFVLVLNSSSAQERKEAKANELFDNYAYIDAVSIYQKIINKGYLSVNALKKAGDAYYFNGKFSKANTFYEKLFDVSNETIPIEYYYRFSQSLKSIENYRKSDSIMSIYNIKQERTRINQNYLNQQNYLELIKINSDRYTFDKFINTPYSEYGATFFRNKVVYVSNKRQSFLSKKIDTWTNDFFSKLYTVSIDSMGKILENSDEKFFKKIDVKYHLSSVTFSPDGDIMYFTANSKIKNNNYDSKKLKIYKTCYNGKNWSEPKELPFNSPNYNVAHPSLNKNGNLLYFASDMPGGFGQSDLYCVEVFQDGSFGTIKNLGDKINTEARETFPFVNNNDLYFSSNGFPGLGGLDVYVSKINVLDHSYNKPYNLGAPINSPYDDFSFTINENRKGYVSSNRERGKGKGNDDIYKIYEKRPLKTFDNIAISGKILDKKDNKPILGAFVNVYNSEFKLLKTIETDSIGEFTTTVENFSQYFLRVEKENYLTSEKQIAISELSEEKKLDTFFIEKRVKRVNIGDNLATYLEIQDIYFDFDKYILSSQSYINLSKIVEYLKENPNIKVDIRTHTDSRGNNNYNLLLSQKRFQSVYSYLVKNGVKESQLSGKGYGETKLLNTCSDESNCSEFQHLINRRCEFIISEIKISK